MILSGQVSSPAGGDTTEITILCSSETLAVYIYYVLNNNFFAEKLSYDEIQNGNGTTKIVDSHSIFYIRFSKVVPADKPDISNAIVKNTDQLLTNIDTSSGKYDSYVITYLAN